MYYSIDKTNSTPCFRYSDGEFLLEGRSHPLFPKRFYGKIYKLVDFYLQHPKEHTDLKIKLEFVNSSSNRSLMKLFKRFKRLLKSGYKVDVEWYYESNDEYSYDLGTMFRSLTGLPFRFISK